jgi:hypothetical protein
MGMLHVHSITVRMQPEIPVHSYRTSRAINMPPRVCSVEHSAHVQHLCSCSTHSVLMSHAVFTVRHIARLRQRNCRRVAIFAHPLLMRECVVGPMDGAHMLIVVLCKALCSGHALRCRETSDARGGAVVGLRTFHGDASAHWCVLCGP